MPRFTNVARSMAEWLRQFQSWYKGVEESEKVGQVLP